MGICLCDKHGRSSIAMVCPHVRDLVSCGRFGRFHRLSPFGDVFCSGCVRACGLDRFERDPRVAGKDLTELDDAALEAYFEALGRIGEGTTAHCAECVAVAEIRQARVDGRPDPYPVYERTLTSHHQVVLRELQAHLSSEFSFQRSMVPPPARGEGEQARALTVRPGTYRQPMTVRAYYVIDPAAQDRIIDLVAGFLDGRELDQARVEFYESEVWESWQDPNTGLAGGYRGREKLLREARLNC